MDRLLRAAGIFLCFQGVAVCAWWGALLVRPGLRAHFDATSEAGLLAFWLPDLLLLGAGSLAAGAAALRRHPLATPAAAAVAGACVYATLYCLAASLATDRGWWGVALMAPAAVLSAAFGAALQPSVRSTMRQSPPASARKHLARTGAQIVVFWSVLLLVVPFFLVRLQGEIGLAPLRLSGQGAAGSVLFLLMSALGLWSARTMATLGEGTPLPLASARRLVVAGPYAYLRNPMALAGLGQGLAVAVVSGSAVVAAYVLVGSALWQWVARPLEEEDLARWFGADYARYREAVRCWIPRRVPFPSMDPVGAAGRVGAR